MNPRFDTYRKTRLGKKIENLATQPYRRLEYGLLSRLGMPAVVALSWELAPLLAGLNEGDKRDAKQFAGAIVGDIMRDDGYEIVNPRGSAQAGGVFTLGAVWALSSDDDSETAKLASEIMDEYAETLTALAKA